MSKAHAFETAKYRNNLNMIAKYLNECFCAS
jgi:hypothetical protein